MKYLWKGIRFNTEQILKSRNSPSATDVVRDLDPWSDRQNSSISVVEECEEHLSEELFGVRQEAVGEEGDDVDCCHALGVKLGRNSFNLSSVGARRTGYHPPPFIGCLAVDEGDDISPNLIILHLFRHRALG